MKKFWVMTGVLVGGGILVGIISLITGLMHM
jgi:hypothetical protein